MHKIAYYDTDYCWKEAKWPDRQHYLLLHRLLYEGSIADVRATGAQDSRRILS